MIRFDLNSLKARRWPARPPCHAPDLLWFAASLRASRAAAPVAGIVGALWSGGVVIDGRLRLGPLGAAGELGHQTIVPDGPLCGCGNRGCLEALASGPAITAEGVRLLLSGQESGLYALVDGDVNRVSPQTIADAAAAGDAGSRFIIERAAEYLCVAAANVVTALHPEMIVITGGVAEIGELLLEPVRRGIRERVRMFPADDVRVEKSQLGDDAGVCGAVALAIQTLESP